MSALQMQSYVAEDTTFLICTGQITIGTAAGELDDKIRSLLAITDHLRLDLAGVTFLDSSGIGVLVRNIGRTKEMNKRITFREISDVARKALRTAHVLNFLEIEASAGSRSLEGMNVAFVHHSEDVRTFISSTLSGHGAQVLSWPSMDEANKALPNLKYDVFLALGESEVPPGAGSRVLRMHSGIFDQRADLTAVQLVAALERRKGARPAGSGA